MNQSLALFAGLAISLSAMAAGRSASITISEDGAMLAAVNNDSQSITLFSLPDHERLAEILVGRDPQTVAFDTSGKRAYVTNRLDDSLTVIDLDTLTVIDSWALPDEPAGVVATADGRVLISAQGTAEVLITDGGLGDILARVTTLEQPRGLALSPDESKLYVSHFNTGKVSVIDLDTASVEKAISTGIDSNLANAMVLNADGTRAWLPHTRSNADNIALLFDTTVFPVVSVLDLESQLHVRGDRVFLDIADRPVNMPIDAQLEGESTLYVANAGSNDLSVIDLTNGRGLAHIEVGDNPTGLALSENPDRLYVNNNLSGTISVIDTGTRQVVDELQSTVIALTSTQLNGKRLFHSTDREDLARDQWISCATCHFNGEMDGRTWFFPDGPRNTTSLLGIGDTLPMHWSGDLDELQDVESTIRIIQAGTGLAEGPDNCDPACDQAPPNAGRSKDLDDLAAFMASLQLPPNPNRESDGGLGDAARRGKTLFESAGTGCAGCHIPPLYTDHSRHDVGTGDGLDEFKGPSFDTPSLRGVYKTAPYLHDGSADTLADVLTTANPEDLHGTTSHLSGGELSDLAAFLRSIGAEGTGFTINAGLSDAWVDIRQAGQGFFIVVFPNQGKVFLAWFTFDTERPDDMTMAALGGKGQRWLTAFGSFEGNRASLDIRLASGGVFDSPVPEVQQASVGTLELEFSTCNAGLVRYALPSLGLEGVIAIERVALDNVALCESLR